MAGKWKWYACLEGENDCWGFESDTRESAIKEAAAEIERLRGELAGRDAEIATWLRDWQEVTYAVTGERLAADEIATAIASGSYRESGNE